MICTAAFSKRKYTTTAVQTALDGQSHCKQPTALGLLEYHPTTAAIRSHLSDLSSPHIIFLLILLILFVR